MKAIEEHGKQLVKSSDEVYLSKLLKPEEIFEKLVEERQDKIQNLSKQIIYNDLRYYFTTKESSPKYFSGFKFPANFWINIIDAEITLETEKNKRSLNRI